MNGILCHYAIHDTLNTHVCQQGIRGDWDRPSQCLPSGDLLCLGTWESPEAIPHSGPTLESQFH